MSAFYFAAMNEEEPTGYAGIVIANSVGELFWGIDEFIDPYSCIIKRSEIVNFCFKYDGQHSEPEFSSGICEIMDSHEEDEWLVFEFNNIEAELKQAPQTLIYSYNKWREHDYYE